MKKIFSIRYLMFGLVTIFLASCGYKPSSHFIKNIFSDTVYVEVLVDRAEPENAAYVKDELNRLIYERFKGYVTSKEKAESQIKAVYEGSTFTPLAYKDGYVTRYRADVRVTFYMKTKRGKIIKNVKARVESYIQASSYISSKLRTEAIRKGLEKALDQFLAYVAAKGTTKKKKTKKIKSSDYNVSKEITN